MLGRRHRRHFYTLTIPMTKIFVIFLSHLTTTHGNSFRQPTRVPGSQHLVVHTDFPYVYWRPSPRPYTPEPPSTPPPDTTRYKYFYGDSVNNFDHDSANWHMLPIQIPDDLVGGLDRIPQTSTESQPYPTSATPQYGLHPGVTEAPHLFHPERLYNGNKKGQDDQRFESAGGPNNNIYHPIHQFAQETSFFQDSLDVGHTQIPPPPQRPDQQKNPNQATSWHQSIMDQLEPFMESHLSRFPGLSRLPKLPGLNSIPSLSDLGVWPLNRKPKPDRKSPAEQIEADKADVIEQKTPHQFHTLPNSYAVTKPAKNRVRYKVTNNNFFPPSGNHNPVYNQQSFSDYQNYDYHQPSALPPMNSFPDSVEMDTDYFPDYSGVHETHDTVPITSDSNRQPESQNIFPNLYNIDPNQNPPFEPEEHIEPYHDNHRYPNRNDYIPPDGEYNPPGDQHPPANNNQRFPGYSQHEQHNQWNKNRPNNNRFRPNNLRRRPPHRRPNIPHHFSSVHQDGINHFLPNATTQTGWGGVVGGQNLPPRRGNRRPNPNYHSIQPNRPLSYLPQRPNIDRLTDLGPLSASVPGGLLVVALALALFYFNFIWYPTPVVTARLVQLISDSAPEDLLDMNQKRAIGEVYEVLQNLETEYGRDSQLWSPECKSRLVCQVHEELPGLWQVTQASTELLRSSLAMGPDGVKDLTFYMEAALEGTREKANCTSKYNTCLLDQVPIRSSLQQLFGLPYDDETEVVYS